MTAFPSRMTVIGISRRAARKCWCRNNARFPPPARAKSWSRSRPLVSTGRTCASAREAIRRRKGAGDIPGLEIAGEVVALGDGVTRLKIGDKVCALVVAGGYAEYCLAYESHALKVPPSLSMVEAAAIPETFFTVWQHLMMRCHMKSGEWVLVHGGTSGIGTTAIMLAKTFGGHVVTTAGSDEKCAAARKLGADVAVNYKTEDFVEATKQATGGKGADVILDIVGGDYIDRNYDAAAEQGRIAQVSFAGNPEGDRKFRAADGKASGPRRLDAASANGRGEGRDRQGHRGKGLAAGRGRKDQAGDQFHFPAGEGVGSPCPHGIEPAYRQDRADRLKGCLCHRFSGPSPFGREHPITAGLTGNAPKSA